MVYCVQAELAFSTAARRDAVLGNIQQKLDAAQKWGTATIVAEAVPAGPNGIRLEVRFTASAAQVDLLQSTESFAVGARAPLAGSTMRLHDCPHDVGGVPCAGVTTRVW